MGTSTTLASAGAKNTPETWYRLVLKKDRRQLHLAGVAQCVTCAHPRKEEEWKGARRVGREQGEPETADGARACVEGVDSGTDENPTTSGEERTEVAALQTAPAPCLQARDTAPSPPHAGVPRAGARLPDLAGTAGLLGAFGSERRPPHSPTSRSQLWVPCASRPLGLPDAPQHRPRPPTRVPQDPP